MFFLGLGQVRALQAATGLGPHALQRRIRNGDWLVDDLIDVIRHGLIGADAMGEDEASTLVIGLFRKHALVEFVGTAVAVISHALDGPEDDMPGKPDPAAMDPSIPPDASSSAPSTQTAPT